MHTRSSRRKAARSRRRRRLLGGALGVTVLAGGAFALLSSHALSSYLAGGASGAASASSLAPRNPAPVSSAARNPALSSPAPRQHHKPGPARTRTPRPKAPTSPTAPAPSAGTATAAARVLAVINQARAQAGLPPYTLSGGLTASASAHNARMAAGCGLSHQCPGEPSLGARETAAGVHWTAAGENIGEGGPEPATAAAIAQMAVTLTQDMLNEQPPNDGHKLNILSAAFHHIGIAVVRDSKGTVWLTQDFSS